jgi:hypothetical protein
MSVTRGVSVVFASSVILMVSGCGALSAESGTGLTKFPFGRSLAGHANVAVIDRARTDSKQARRARDDSLTVVADREFDTADEAVAAFGRANRTRATVVALIRDSKRPGISQEERAEKAAEIARLQRQARAEMEPVRAFYRELIRKANEKRR